METEKFKGDETELKFEAAGQPALDQISISLDDFYANSFEASPFILMLYDQKRVPFYDRVKRIAFVEFYKEILKRFPVVGTFDTYLFVLGAIFGSVSDIRFDVPLPGVLYVDVNSASNLEFDFIGRDAEGNIFEMIDDQGYNIAFRGISGIETAYDLELLFSEIMPAGISPHVSLSFFSKYNFIAEDASDEISDVIDSFGNNIIFTEVGI
jgi:hypothetical protein